MSMSKLAIIVTICVVTIAITIAAVSAGNSNKTQIASYQSAEAAAIEAAIRIKH